jgi:hypothetical protein
MRAAEEHIANRLHIAQYSWTDCTSVAMPEAQRHESLAWFMHHVTTAVLLENLRRLDPDLADRLTRWLLGPDGIFNDGYAGELLHEWREQLAAGQPMAPVAPPPEEPDHG